MSCSSFATSDRVLIDRQIVMALDAALVGVTAEWLVSSINGLVEANPSLSREWVGLILLPIVSRFEPHQSIIRKVLAELCFQVGNAAEHFTAVSVSVKDKIDLSISVAVRTRRQLPPRTWACMR